MACGCVTFECLRIPFDPCNTGFEIPVAATETTNADIEVLFNGSVKTFQVAIIEGDNIILPTSAFNESYTHEVEISYSGESTCYKLTTIPATGLPDFEPIPPVNGGLFGTVEIDDYTTTFEVEAGRTVQVILPGNQAWVRDKDFTQSGTTITIINESNVEPGTLTYLYTDS
jgi:hypothetical protein